MRSLLPTGNVVDIFDGVRVSCIDNGMPVIVIRAQDLGRTGYESPAGHIKAVSVEHPTGEFTVEIEVDPANPQNVVRAALLRTARLTMRGEVLVPHAVWDGETARSRAA